jgi:hypothetical protein
MAFEPAFFYGVIASSKVRVGGTSQGSLNEGIRLWNVPLVTKKNYRRRKEYIYIYMHVYVV